MFDSTNVSSASTQNKTKHDPAYYWDLTWRFAVLAGVLLTVVFLTQSSLTALLDGKAPQGETLKFSQPISQPKQIPPLSPPICDEHAANASQTCHVRYTFRRLSDNNLIFTAENADKAKSPETFNALWDKAANQSTYRQWMQAWFSATFVGFLAALFSYFIGEAIYQRADAEFVPPEKRWKIPLASPEFNNFFFNDLPRAFTKALPSQIGAMFVGLGTLAAMAVFVVKERFDLRPDDTFRIDDANWNDNANVFRVLYDTLHHQAAGHHGYFLFLSILLVLLFIAPVALGILMVVNLAPRKFRLTTNNDGIDRRITEASAAAKISEERAIQLEKKIIADIAAHFPGRELDKTSAEALDHLKGDLAQLQEEIGLHQSLQTSVKTLREDIAGKKNQLSFKVERECATAHCEIGQFQKEAANAAAALTTCEDSLQQAGVTLADKIRCFREEFEAKSATEVMCNANLNAKHQALGEMQTHLQRAAELQKEKAARGVQPVHLSIEGDKLSLEHARYEGHHEFVATEDVKSKMIIGPGMVLAFFVSTLTLIFFGNLLLAPDIVVPLDYRSGSVGNLISSLLSDWTFWTFNLILTAGFLFATFMVYILLPKFMAAKGLQRMVNFLLFGVLAAVSVWFSQSAADLVRKYIAPEAAFGPAPSLVVKPKPASPVAPINDKPLEFAPLACGFGLPGKDGKAFIFNRQNTDLILVDPSQCLISDIDATKYNYYVVIGLASEEGGVKSGKNKDLAQQRANALGQTLSRQVNGKPITIYSYNHGVHECTLSKGDTCPSTGDTRKTAYQRILIVMRGYSVALADKAKESRTPSATVVVPVDETMATRVEEKMRELDLGDYSRDGGGGASTSTAVTKPAPAVR